MPIDAYSFCPCGTGKKIKFCCPDLLGELKKIDRMVEGEQYIACLKHIERLQQRHSDRACLMALRSMLLRATGQSEAAAANAAAFVERHPDSMTALAESAITIALDRGGRAAMGSLQRALAVSAGAIESRVYEAMGVVAEVLLTEGEWLAGRALLQLQIIIVGKDDPRPAELLLELNRLPSVPLLFKDDQPMATPPDDAPWKARFDEAMAPIRTGNWQAAAERLAALAEEMPDSPAIWQNLAMLRGWLADRPGCIEALRKFAALDVPLEDAVEAEARAMLLAEDPLGDRLDVLDAAWTVNDVEQLQVGFTLDRRAMQISFDPSALQGDDDTPPPKTAYLLLDRPVPETAEGMTLDTAARILGRAMLFGRQTDREARLEVVNMRAADLQQVKAMLGELAGESLGPEAKEEVTGQVSASRDLLRFKCRLPDDVSPGQIETLADEHLRDALLVRWPKLELGIFDGKSPAEVTGDESWQIKLLAAVMVLESWTEQMQMSDRFEFNELRSERGLPTLEPIDPEQAPLEAIPLVRWSRVMVEKVSDEALLAGYQQASMFGARAALRKFAQAVIDRPSLAGKEEQLVAYSVLARMEEDPDRALQHVEQGRTAAESAEQSSARWDLLELSLRFHRREGAEARRLVEHIQQEHFEEPGVAEALTQFLIHMGVLHGDGTAAGPPPEEEPAVAANVQSSAEPTKIWTPDSEQPAGEKKLWTPD